MRVRFVFQRQYTILRACRKLTHCCTVVPLRFLIKNKRRRDVPCLTLLSIPLHPPHGTLCGLRHPAQGFFKTWRYALDKPGANNRFRTALEQCLTCIFAVDAGFFRTLTTQNFWINITFTTDATVIGLFPGVSSPGARETVRHGESSHFCGHGADSVCHRGGDGHRQHEIFLDADPFPVRGLWVRLSESSSLRTYITLTLPLLPFISSFMLFSTSAARSAQITRSPRGSP